MPPLPPVHVTYRQMQKSIVGIGPEGSFVVPKRRIEVAHGHRYHPLFEDDHGAPVARLTAFATGLALVTYPDGQYELLGAKPSLGCLFGDRVTELEVCAERHLASNRYRGLLAR